MINGGKLILPFQIPFHRQFLLKGRHFKLVPLSSFPVMYYENGTSNEVLWSCYFHDTPSTVCFLRLCSRRLMINFSNLPVPNFLPSSLLGPDQKVWLLVYICLANLGLGWGLTESLCSSEFLGTRGNKTRR